MIAAGSGRCVVPCRLLAPLVARRHGVPRLCRLPAAATAATAAAEQQWEAAGLHSSAAPGVRDLDRLQLDVERKLGIPLEIYRAAGGVRVRQHVNPLKKELQVPTEPPVWEEVYEQPGRPMVLDLGCGYGRFLLALSKAMPGHNMAGLEIRAPIIERANKWAVNLGLDRSVLFLRGNATITLQHTLGGYPGPLDLVCVQFPDPHFKARHKKRHTVQRQTVEALGRLMAPGARVFLQSDVLGVAEHMRDTFEQHGSAWFAPCREAHGGATFCAASEPPPPQQQQHGEQAQQGASAAGGQAQAQQQQHHHQQHQQQQQEQQEASEPQWESEWAASGWLRDNPLGVPTEREVLTTEQGLPVYRLLLRRT